MKYLKLFENNPWHSIISDEEMKKMNSYSYKVRGRLIDVYCDENGISEKAFSKLDQIIPYIDNIIESNEFVKTTIDEFENKKRRANYCAEYIYENTKDNLLKIDVK